MALGDGSAWDETNPTDATVAINIDDHNRDLRIGIRSRMALEHEWPASQAATSEGGVHKFITLQNLATVPSIAGTQIASVYSKTVGAGLSEVFAADESNNETQITDRGAILRPTDALVQVVSTQSGAVATGTTTIPADDSIPEKTEGDQYMSLVITPKNTNNKLLILISISVTNTATTPTLVAALFQDSITNSLAGKLGGGLDANTSADISFSHSMTAGSVSAITFKVRAGSPSAGTTTFNGSGGGRKLGGVLVSSIIIFEFKG